MIALQTKTKMIFITKISLVEQRVFCRKMSGDDDDHAQRRVVWCL